MVSNQYTKQRERESVTVETVTETEELVICACCDQAYSDDSAVTTVGVELDADGEARETRPLCTACASAALDYEGPTTLGYSAKRAAELHPIETLKGVAASVAQPVISLGVMTLVGGVGISVLNEVVGGLQGSELQPVSKEVATTGAILMDLLGVMVFITVFAILTGIVMGPRRL